MNTKIIALIVVVLLAGGAYVAYNSNKNKTEVAGQNETAQSQTEAKVETGSFASLIASGTSRKCTYASNKDDVTTSGVIYVSGGKMRGDITAGVTGNTAVTHMMNDGKYTYIWNDNDTFAYKMAFDANDVKDIQNSATAQQSVDFKQNYDFSCESWDANSTAFELPSGIEFKDLPSMPAASAGASAASSADVKAMQQNICAGLSGTAKDECTKMIK